MAQVVDSLPTRRKYPWAEWLDGRVWELTAGEDFAVGDDLSTEDLRKLAEKNFKNTARVTAYRQGYRLECRSREGKVYIKATKKETKDA